MRVTALLLLVLCGCPSKPMGTGTPPEKFCPYGPGCEKGNSGTLKVGIAAVKVTPRGFERPRPDFLKRSGDTCHEQGVAPILIMQPLESRGEAAQA